MEVQQSLLLLPNIIHLLLHIAGASTRLFMMMSRPREQRGAEPFLHDLRLLDPIEQRDHLLVDFFLAQPVARVILGRVPRTAVVDVALAGLLHDDLARDRASAMAAGNQLAAVGQLVRLVDFVAEKLLHASKRVEIDQRLMFARLPAVVVFDVTDVRAVTKHAMHFAALPDRLFGREDAPFGFELLDGHIERAVFEGVEMEDSLHVFRFRRFDPHGAAAILSHADIPVRRNSREPTFAHAPAQAFAHVQ